MEVIDAVCITKFDINKCLSKILDRFYMGYLDISSMNLEPRMSFPVVEDGYSRNRIYMDEEIEVVVAVWGSRFKSKPHDHGESYCMFSVLKGGVFNTDVIPNHDLSGYTIKSDALLMAGDISELLSPNDFHLIENHTNKASITLNVYSPPISKYRSI